MATPPSITERYPPLPLGETVDLIRRFGEADPDERDATIRRFVEVHPVLCYDWGGGWRYRRARALQPGEEPRNVSELIWRADMPAKLGRANPAGFRVLYLADRRDTALSEVRVSESHVAITEFTVRPGRSLRVAPVGELTQVQRTGRGFLAGNASSTINGMINACEPEEGRSMLIADAFLLDCLTNRQDDYALSSMVALAIFEKLREVAAVAYPSRRQLGAMNFAVRVDRVWDDWGIISVRRAHARHLAMGHYALSDVRHVTGIYANGDLLWDETSDDDPDSAVQLDPAWWPEPAH
jgi:hypothetical protein